jgi:outer membrane protein assembly factor BamB
MHFSKSKTAAAIALFLMLTIAFTMVALPPAGALDWPTPIPTWTYIGVTPADVVGVNQEVIIVFWCNFIPPTAIGEYGDRWTFHVDVTTPSGTETLGGSNGFESDPVGGSWTTYMPTEVGTYTFVARMDAHTIDGGKSRNAENPFGPVTWPSTAGNQSIGDQFQASESEPVSLTVQEEPVARYDETPLPTDYWTRPIYGANHLWGAIAGNWLNAADAPGRINAYTEGPESSHILWTRSFWTGGVMGGSSNVNFGPAGYYSGQSYENFGGPSIIMNGKMYYKVGVNPIEGWYCVDMYTGETVYYRNTTGAPSGVGGPFAGVGNIPYGAPAFGQIYDYESPNQHGGIPYLWVTATGKSNTWDMLDGFTGNYICSIGDIPTWAAGGGFFFGGAAATSSYGLDGSILRYAINNIAPFGSPPDYYLQCWNTSKVIIYPNTLMTGNQYWMWRPGLGTVYNGTYGYSINASVPNSDGILQVVEGKEVITGYMQIPSGFGSKPLNNGTYSIDGRISAYNLDENSDDYSIGEKMWTYNFTTPAGLGDEALQNLQFSQHDVAYGGISADAGIFWYTNTMLRTRYTYDLSNGKLLWTSDPEAQWNFYGMSTSVYQGTVFSYGYSGVLIAYNATTGDVLWNWTAPFYGIDESAYPHTPLSMGCIADGKLYFYSSEHSPSQPLRRDGHIWCVDATTGEMLWQITCWPSAAPIIADGRIVVVDLFDAEIYCYGKGPSATTVTASPEISVNGDGVMIKGTVTDQSPSGRHNEAGSLDFSLKGTPAIADSSMDAWMEYMFHQRPMPQDAKGVEVVLETLDPNGNFYEIGNVTTDLTGNYAFPFTPDVPGMYTIIASFKGSAAYGSSFAQTYINVEEMPQATPTPTPPPEPPTGMYILGSTIGIIIAIAVVGLVVVLMLRRR